MKSSFVVDASHAVYALSETESMITTTLFMQFHRSILINLSSIFRSFSENRDWRWQKKLEVSTPNSSVIRRATPPLKSSFVVEATHVVDAFSGRETIITTFPMQFHRLILINLSSIFRSFTENQDLRWHIKLEHYYQESNYAVKSSSIVEATCVAHKLSGRETVNTATFLMQFHRSFESPKFIINF